MTDRKYRQKGYQDGDNRDRRPSGREPVRGGDGPRGRGLGTPTATVSKCSRCGTKVSAAPDFEAVCSSCGSDLHSCANCRHFDTSAPLECRKPIETRIPTKSKRNSCSEFEARLVQEFESDSRGGARDAKAAFDDLFNL
ncbi:MAG: hypothetical protein ACE5GX_20540 [Thermoanaerobaculia bacterium]